MWITTAIQMYAYFECWTHQSEGVSMDVLFVCFYHEGGEGDYFAFAFFAPFAFLLIDVLT